jgi:hypothetical protein
MCIMYNSIRTDLILNVSNHVVGALDVEGGLPFRGVSSPHSYSFVRLTSDTPDTDRNFHQLNG